MYKGTTKVAVKTVRLAASANDKEDFVQEVGFLAQLNPSVPPSAMMFRAESRSLVSSVVLPNCLRSDAGL
jgi:hypothetical protein